MPRSPDDAKVKQKMLFASSKEALKRSLVGVAAEIQGTDFSEVAYDSGMPSHSGPKCHPFICLRSARQSLPRELTYFFDQSFTFLRHHVL
jgi:hypothetical protein